MKEKFWKRTWNGNQRLVGTWEEILQEKYFRFRQNLKKALKNTGEKGEWENANNNTDIE